MKKVVTKSVSIAGRTLTLEVGRMAQQTNSSILARYGDTMVLVTVLSNRKKQGSGFMPLSVDYVERLYAGGIIKGSRWVKREGRPTDDAILASRLIDRSLRPLFPSNFFDEVQVIVTLLSTDGQNSHDLLSLIAASAALHISDIPWNGPIGAVQVGYINQNGSEAGIVGPVVNPLISEMEYSDLDLTVTATQDRVVMIEAGAKQLPEDKMLEAVEVGLNEIKTIIKIIEELKKEVGKQKYTYSASAENADLKQEIERYVKKELDENELKRVFLAQGEGETSRDTILDQLVELLGEKYSREDIQREFDKILKKKIRAMTLSGSRLDGRKYDQIRPIDIEIGLLPRTHGSALFSRGLTQVLSVATLANPSLEQWIETAEGMEEKRYIHHYSMPPYATGETGRIGTPGRREIALAEKAIASVVPSQDAFPYTIRVVSEIMSSDGSTSMASTCGSTLALMDAGVPILAPVAGISIGLMDTGKKDGYVLLTDIRGLEDFNGNMDFKVAGSEAGITAIQLDVKLNDNFTGLNLKMISETFEAAKKARLEVLEKMLAVIPQSRKGVSQYAPKVVTIKIPQEKIGEVIGPGGKNIRNIIATTAAAVDMADDGTVTISSIDPEAVEKAVKWIEGMTREIQVGEIYEGEVKRILPFGAFVEIVPGKEGLVHVSKMSGEFVTKPEDVVNIGSQVRVWVDEIDEMGRVNLSMLFDEGGVPLKKERAPRMEGPRRDFGPRRDSGFDRGRGGPRRGGFGGGRSY